jgi:DNA-binding transcriptional LysR family regulator
MTQVDLNLLDALDVLLAEGSVTAAAARLHLSVPATSRTLARIRVAFDDPILVRAGRGLVPTPRALALQGRVHRLVEEAHALVDMGRGLDLIALERTFTVRANDALISLIAARLVSQIEGPAPGVRLRFVAEGQEDLAPLRDGTVDLDLGVIHDLGPEVLVEDLYEEHLVGMVSGGHRLARGRVTLRRLASATHVAVSRRGRPRGALDAVLEEHGLTRRVVAVVPTYTSAAHMVLTSGLVGLFPAQYAAQVTAISGAWAFPIPADLPRLVIAQAWHLRHDTDPAHHWLRGQLRQATRPC